MTHRQPENDCSQCPRRVHKQVKHRRDTHLLECLKHARKLDRQLPKQTVRYPSKQRKVSTFRVQHVPRRNAYSAYKHRSHNRCRHQNISKVFVVNFRPPGNVAQEHRTRAQRCVLRNQVGHRKGAHKHAILRASQQPRHKHKVHSLQNQARALSGQ